MKKSEYVGAVIVSILGIVLLVLSGCLFVGMPNGNEKTRLEILETEGTVLKDSQKLSEGIRDKVIMRVATGDSVSCLNLWKTDGTAGTEPMTVYYGNEDAGVLAPQVIYARDATATSIFCIEYGSALSSGNHVELVGEQDYDNLNEQQKTAISLVLGCAEFSEAPRDEDGSYVKLNTGACTFENFRKYVSTQLMLWYFIDRYSGTPGQEGSGGISWGGVERTCHMGWGNLEECLRIYNRVMEADVRPEFTGSEKLSAPLVELELNETTGWYETIVTDSNQVLFEFEMTDMQGLECMRCNPDGSENANGNALRIRSQHPISEEMAISLTLERRLAGATVYYLINQDESQVCTYSGGGKDFQVFGYLRVMANNVPTVEIEKRDADTNAFIEGVTLQLWSDSQLLDEWQTTKEAYSTRRLQAGKTYRLHEKQAADGYLSHEDMEFTVEDIELPQTITLYNSKTTVDIGKLAEDTKTWLPGAKLELMDGDNQVDCWISTSGYHRIRGLVVGKTYCLRELTAPDGYECSEALYFTVDGSQSIQLITLENQPVTTTEVTTEMTTEVVEEADTGITTEVATEAVEEAASEEKGEYPTAVAGVSMQKALPMPETGDKAVPFAVLIGLIAGGVLFSVIRRKK